ncbi:MAG TPA: OmpA family protein, partial [Methylophilaceae bacterium]|nr:OmpA family protein [Methylophilaceae bacterium]
GVDALYMFSRDRFRPFVLAGLGLAYNDIDYDVAGVNIGNNKTSWMANVGLGAQFMVTEALGLQADARYVWSRADVKSNATAVGGMNFNNTDTVGNTYLNLGVIWKFGVPKPVAAAEPEPMPAPEPAVAAPEPMPEPVPVPAPCKPTFETVTISAEKLFAFDKSSLKDGSRPILDEVAEKIKQHTDIELVMVTGHTDRIGSDAYNQKLSERRANTVKEYLVSQGVDASRLQAVGKGESQPVVDCAGVHGSKKIIECLAPNRRVVVEATHKEEVGCK